MMATSKRPIVCTTSSRNYVSSLSGGALAKHISSQRTFTFQSVAPSLVAQQLQMLALTEGFYIAQSPDLIGLFEDDSRRRVSSSIHVLQAAVMSSTHQHEPKCDTSQGDFEEVFRQTSVTATEKGFEPSKLVNGKNAVKSRDTLSDLQLQPVENKRELMRQLSARCDGQISNFPLKETAGGELMLKSWRELKEEESRRDDCNSYYYSEGGEHHLVQSAVNEDILASNLFEMGSSSCQHHISQEHFANKNLHLDALPVLRQIARVEETRRLEQGKAKGRGSRSRFLHYFETQEVYLKAETLTEMVKSFQAINPSSPDEDNSTN